MSQKTWFRYHHNVPRCSFSVENKLKKHSTRAQDFPKWLLMGAVTGVCDISSCTAPSWLPMQEHACFHYTTDGCLLVHHVVCDSLSGSLRNHCKESSITGAPKYWMHSTTAALPHSPVTSFGQGHWSWCIVEYISHVHSHNTTLTQQIPSPRQHQVTM